MEKDKETVVAIVGPTAVGKTSLSLALATHFDGEIISGDSMQIYQGMDIATAKASKEEQQVVPHHLIDILAPDASYSVADFKQAVEEKVAEIHRRDKLPILVGGTGLYIDAFIRNYQLADVNRDVSYEENIKQAIATEGVQAVYQRLETVDPKTAATIHPNNERRLIRALEVYDRTGKTMSDLREEQAANAPYHVVLIGLEMERDILYQRINQRVEEMIENGLVEEARHFYNRGFKTAQSMKAIGYKELIPYFEGALSLAEAVELLKRNSRRYAKRQYTWFRNKMDVSWYQMSVTEKDEIFEKIIKDLAGILNSI